MPAKSVHPVPLTASDLRGLTPAQVRAKIMANVGSLSAADRTEWDRTGADLRLLGVTTAMPDLVDPSDDGVRRQVQ